MKDKKAAKKIIKNKSLWSEAEILYAKTVLYLRKKERLDKKDK
tara:strand:+ start:46 stop:174 length:129 start_codon:yes stop_codon:yes gene_type:complete